MRRWLFVFAVVIVSTLPNQVSYAQVTAYSALRTLGSTRGEKALGQILSVSGEGASAQPNQWRVCLDDPAARGGVRELEITGNQITSERTPVKSEWTGAREMDLTQLNLDSDGAYQMAAQEANKKGIDFSAVQYQLAIDPQTGKPGWTLQLSDSRSQRIGAVKIDADSGSLVGAKWGQGIPNAVAQQRTPGNQDERFLDSPESQATALHRQDTQSEVPATKPIPSENQNSRYAETQDVPDNSNPDPGSGSASDRARRYAQGAENFGLSVVHRIERPFLRAGGWIQKKVTGRDTLSPPSNDQDNDDDD